MCYKKGGKPVEFEEEEEFKSVVKVINANPGEMKRLHFRYNIAMEFSKHLC